MFKQISIYSILLLSLAALTFFLTTYYSDTESIESETENLNIFQAKDVNLKLNSFDSDFDINLKSKMINGLSDSKILDIFDPIINLKNSEIEMKISAENSELNYETNELFIPKKTTFKGRYFNKPFNGVADQIKFNLSKNKILFSGNLEVVFDGKEYKGKNIEINTKLKSIINSQNLSIKVIDDLKSK